MQLVMVAMTISPLPRLKSVPATGTRACDSGQAAANAAGAPASGTRASGRPGPATQGSTAPRSISMMRRNEGTEVDASRHSPCARA